ncbi:hypothetical protein BTVI_145181 [Pitangus sulphuratus]|nr:hypothetical protein BTVI_145181 [Pitangus sulphuratus]
MRLVETERVELIGNFGGDSAFVWYIIIPHTTIFQIIKATSFYQKVQLNMVFYWHLAAFSFATWRKNPLLKKASSDIEASSKECELCKRGKSTIGREVVKGREAGVAWIKARWQGREIKILEELGLRGEERDRMPKVTPVSSSEFEVHPLISNQNIQAAVEDENYGRAAARNIYGSSAQPKPSLAELETMPSCLTESCLGEEANPHLAKTSFHVIVENDEVSPERSLLQDGVGKKSVRQM